MVYGTRNIVHLRQVVYAAEDEFFGVFNSLNSNDEFDVDCNYVWRIEQHRRIRECRANFVQNYEEDFANPWAFANLATLRRKEKLLAEELFLPRKRSRNPQIPSKKLWFTARKIFSTCVTRSTRLRIVSLRCSTHSTATLFTFF